MKIPDQYVKELVHSIASDRGVDVVFLIKDKENVSEFKIAEKLGITVNEVRNSLYKLQDKNLVFFTRKKDKKKGWYIYFWNFDKIKAYDLLVEMKHEKKKQLQQVLQQEKQGTVYVCPNKCVRVKAEEALEYQFKCPECDAVLIEENLEKRTEKVRKEIEVLQRELEELSKIEKPAPKLETKKGGKKQKEKKVSKKPIKKIPPKPKRHVKKIIKHKPLPPKKHIPKQIKKPTPKKMPHKEIKKPLPKKETHPQPRHVPPPPRYVPPPPPAQEEPKKGFFGRIKSKFS